MAETTHYAKAPITEALIDVHILNGKRVNVRDLDSLTERIVARYPRSSPLKPLQITFGTGVSGTAESEQIGVVYRDNSEKDIFQARVNGATLSRLSPYQSWKTLVGEFREVWTAYEDVIKPGAVSRIAVRYVNRIDIPLPFADFKEYILTCPEVAPKLPQALSGFLMQVHIPQTDIGAMLILSEALASPAREGVASVVLDIDLYCEIPFTADIWGVLETLHLRKNQIFEACITDRTREMIR